MASGAASSSSAQYTGRENDGTGLYYYRARYYSPSLHRFISEDPIGFAGGVNLYAYSENDPVNLKDPTGLFVCTWHRWITWSAAFDARYRGDSDRLAQQVCDVDDEDTANSDLAQHTHQHGMAGRKPNLRYESCGEAYDGNRAMLERFMRS